MKSPNRAFMKSPNQSKSPDQSPNLLYIEGGP